DYLDINENPNGVNHPSPAALLASVTNSSGMNTFRVANLTSHYVQYLASDVPSSNMDTYQEVDGSSTWNSLYNTMSDLWVLKQRALQNVLPGYKGIADILTAYNLSMLINIWGDIPFSQAFSGDFLNPEFDNQKALYDTCLLYIENGISA